MGIGDIFSGAANAVNGAIGFAAGKVNDVYGSISGRISSIKNRNAKSDADLLIDAIIKAHSELERAEITFNEMTDNAAIDYAAYSIMAARARYVYLLSLAKENNIKF